MILDSSLLSPCMLRGRPGRDSRNQTSVSGCPPPPADLVPVSSHCNGRAWEVNIEGRQRSDGFLPLEPRVTGREVGTTPSDDSWSEPITTPERRRWLGPVSRGTPP